MRKGIFRRIYLLYGLLAVLAVGFAKSISPQRSHANVMIAAWGGIAGSKPPSVSVSLRSATASHGNIMARKAFTISLPSEAHAAQADYFGIASGRDQDKFKVSGLTAVRSDVVDAPYVGEFPFVLECSVMAVPDLGLHTQFVGEIKDVKVDDALLGDDGRVELGRLRPLIFVPDSQAFHAVGAFVGKAFSLGSLWPADPDPRSPLSAGLDYCTRHY